MDQTLKRIAPLTGVAFVALYVISAILVFGDAPGLADGEVEDIVAYYSDKKDSIVVGTLLVTFSAPLFLWFSGCLRSAIARAEGGSGRLAATAFGGAAAATAVGVSAPLINLMGVLRVDETGSIDPATATALFDISYVLFAAAAQAAAATLLLATAVAALRYRAVLPRWLALVTIPIGVAMLIPAVGLVALFVALGWVVIVSVLLYQEGGT